MPVRLPFARKSPVSVVQEIYGWLLAHWAVRCLMFQASTEGNISPLRLGFTSTLLVLHRAVPLFQQAAVSQSECDCNGNSTVTLFVSWLIEEILEQEIPPRQGRTNPRVVKKPRSKFPSRKRAHRGHGTQLQPPTFAISPPPQFAA